MYMYMYFSFCLSEGNNLYSFSSLETFSTCRLLSFPSAIVRCSSSQYVHTSYNNDTVDLCFCCIIQVLLGHYRFIITRITTFASTVCSNLSTTTSIFGTSSCASRTVTIVLYKSGRLAGVGAQLCHRALLHLLRSPVY